MVVPIALILILLTGTFTWDCAASSGSINRGSTTRGRGSGGRGQSPATMLLFLVQWFEGNYGRERGRGRGGGEVEDRRSICGDWAPPPLHTPLLVRRKGWREGKKGGLYGGKRISDIWGIIM
jgi:hypothetical protein